MNAEDQTRTGTVVTYRRILSPVRLPIPPLRLGKFGGGATQTRTGGKAFAELCLTTWLWRLSNHGAEDGIRTRDPRLGKAMLYP